MLRALDQIGPQWIAFHVAQHRQQMLVVFDGEGLEAPLPQVAAGSVVAVVAAHMRVEEPVHPMAEVAVVVRPQDQMKVVGHQTSSEYTDGHLDAGMAHGLDKRLVVAVLGEDAAAGVAPVEDMVTLIANRDSCGTRHGPRVNAAMVVGKKKREEINMDVPFLAVNHIDQLRIRSEGCLGGLNETNSNGYFQPRGRQA
jgi:hypothetical protein